MDTFEIFVIREGFLDFSYQFSGKHCAARARIWFDSLVNEDKTRIVHLSRIRTSASGLPSIVALAHYRRNAEAWLQWDKRAIAARRASVSCAQAGVFEAMQEGGYAG